jgi:hypothetical protein
MVTNVGLTVRRTPLRDNFRLADHSGVGLFNHHKRVFQERSIQLDLDTCFGLFSPTETLLPILSFIREW